MDKFPILIFDLQLFAEERTEKPTPRKKREARQKGQVAKSGELNSALILLCSFLFLKYYSSWAGLRMLNFTNQLFSEPFMSNWTEAMVNRLFHLTVTVLLQICLPLMGIVVVTGFIANYMQVGLIFTGYPLQPKLERINPIEGFKRIFSRRAIVELLKASIKIFLVAYLIYSTIIPNLGLFPALLDMSIGNALKNIGGLCSRLVLRAAMLLLVLAIFDYVFQYWEHDKSLKMSKKELKEEYRQYEGDPYVRSRIKQRQRQLSVSRMMQEVPKADVIITNPTHYAVALRYLSGEMPAPVIVAKGVDQLALRIKALAKEHEIIIYEDPALAQALYKSVDVGKVIPPELYEAVARVLAFIYRLQPARWERTR